MAELASQDHKPELPVSDFYRDAVVLITGGTGLVGKILVEKLLRSLDVKKIYLLVREKKNQKPADRLKQLIKDPLFDTIRRETVNHDALFAKLEAVDVDFTAEEFVKEPYKSVLLRGTQIVFNVMGNVRMSDTIRSSLENNVASVEKLYNFLRNAENLQSVVHVSTFYSNCDRAHIEEVVYEDIPFGGLANLRHILEQLTDSEVEALTPTILRKLPNSYVFSKKCAEVMIKQQYSDLPVGIFRPPIVVPSYREPVPGWVDSLQAITGLSVPILQKRFLWYYGDPDAIHDIAPVDYCAAAMIAIAADIRARNDTTMNSKSIDEPNASVPVYNYYFEKGRQKWSQYISRVGSSAPSSEGRTTSFFGVRMTKCRLLSRITFTLLYLQAHLSDFLLGLVGRPKRQVRTVAALDNLQQTVKYAIFGSWTARNDNTRRVRTLLSTADEKLLEFDVDRIDWNYYYKHYAEGLLLWLRQKTAGR